MIHLISCCRGSRKVLNYYSENKTGFGFNPKTLAKPNMA